MEFIDLLRDEFPGKVRDLRESLPESVEYTYDLRKLAQVDMVVVHHSDTPATTTWQVMANYHVQHHGWPGIGYHLGIDPDGTIYYLGDLDTRRYHAREANARSIGICCRGDYSHTNPAPAMLDALGRLIGVLRSFMGLQLQVVGHRDVCQTECPGDRLYAALATLQVMPPPPSPRQEPAEEEAVTTPEKARWWTEEAIRLIETGNPGRARSVLQPVVKYLYGLEQTA